MGKASQSWAGYCSVLGNCWVGEGREGWRREGKSRKGPSRAGWITEKRREGKGRTGKGESVPRNTREHTNRKTVLSVCCGGDFPDRGFRAQGVCVLGVESGGGK